MGKLFGTNGVRGYANDDMNSELAMKLGLALGSFLKEGDTVLLGRDTRTSGPMLASALAAGLQTTGVNVLDCGVVPTPALQYRVKNSNGRFAAGAVVTASHNPPEFNGIKFIDPDGTEMRSDKEDAIEEIYFAEKFRRSHWSRIGETGVETGVNEEYVDACLSHIDLDAVGRAKLTVVLDTSNGAGSVTAPWLLRKAGVHVITLNAQPDGTFPGHPSEPTPENVKDLITATKAFGANIGVVQDGDADRCVFIDENGGYVQGDRVLALMAGYAVEQKKGGSAESADSASARGRDLAPLIVTPVSSSSIVEEHVKSKGGRLEYTRVGAPIVARYMKDNDAAFGGEENGGLIWPEHQFCRDASMTLAKVLELLATSGKPFSQLLKEVPTASNVKKKVECPNDRKQKTLDGFAKAHAEDKVDRTDGVKVYMSDGWVLVRPSGTEPIFRVYAEAKTPDQAEQLADRSLAEIREIISKSGP